MVCKIKEWGSHSHACVSILSYKNFLIIVLIAFLFSPGVCIGEIYCIQNVKELEFALDVAASNKEDDILLITKDVKLGKFRIPNEAGYSISFKGGFSKDCTKREINKKNNISEIEQRVDGEPNISPQQSTTGPVPPSGIFPKKEVVNGDLLGEQGGTMKVIGASGYLWRHGCGPTAVGMVIGYYDGKGCPDLFPGSASTQTSDVNQCIASQRSSNDPGHYEDYSQPIDSYPTLLTDNSEIGGGHAGDSVADYMETSWSSRSNYYGWSWSSDIDNSFIDYVNSKNTAYLPQVSQYSMGGSLTWNVLTHEIDNNRPMVFLVDTDGNGGTDHFVTIVGYNDTPTQQYGCLDTWSPVSTVRWSEFRTMSSSYSWGIWGGWAFTVTPEKSPSIMPWIPLLLLDSNS